MSKHDHNCNFLSCGQECNCKAVPVIHEVLFDGYAVLNELTDAQKHFVSPEAVSAVLDAVVRLIKKSDSR